MLLRELSVWLRTPKTPFPESFLICADDDHGLRLHSLLHGVLRKKGLWELIGSGCFVVQTKPECRTAIYVREPSKPMSQVSAICPLRDGEWDKCTKEYPFISDTAREMLG